MKSLKLLAALLLTALAGEAAALGGLVDLDVYDRSEGRLLPVHWHEGRAYVAGRPGNEYALRLHNGSREEILAVISVDGVNVITGETASAAQSGYVLAPGRSLDLPAETVMVYYDSRRNLTARAAIRAPITPRFPHPFPAFVPDPPA